MHGTNRSFERINSFRVYVRKKSRKSHDTFKTLLLHYREKNGDIILLLLSFSTDLLAILRNRGEIFRLFYSFGEFSLRSRANSRRDLSRILLSYLEEPRKCRRGFLLPVERFA